ncbi:unnamed protein product [Litomosoides sigmodontis]|uniref:ATP-dependent RNA helicase n=1 Tax=Litomosoides sigmodontis TaxID=42156 RepID=A0A3P6T5W0_LITSI|nr:unnamed protein product [Litomosoides sigmodontis]
MSLFGGPKQNATSASSTVAPAFTFGAATLSAANKPLFGSTTAAQLSTATPTFAQSGGLFGSKPGTATSSTGLLSSGIKPAGLPGTSTAQSAQASQFSTVQDLIQNSECLIKSLTSPDLFGDERDGIIAKLNQLLSACAVGSGYYKGDQQPISYTTENPFYQFKAIGYSRRSDYCDSDGIVALTLGINYEQLSNAVQRQKFIDSMNLILGNNTNVRAHIELIRPLPDNQTEVLLYVTEKGNGRSSSKELCAFLKQPAQETQMKNQLCVVNVLSRITVDNAKKHAFIKNPPAGFDSQIWQQAVRENPDPDKLLPYPIRGFEQLRKRQELQAAEIRLEERVIEELKQRLVQINCKVTAGQNQCSYQRQRHKELSHRLLRCLAMQSLLQQYTISIDSAEEKLETRLEALNASLIAPNQIKSRINDLLAILHGDAEILKATSGTKLKLTESDLTQIKRYLYRAQEALERVVDVAIKNICSSKITMELDQSDNEKPGTSVSSDEISEAGEQEEHTYKVLGHGTFENLKKIHIVPAWIKRGETFASELDEDSCAELDLIKGLHPLLSRCVREHLKQWYPVQRAVLPYLVAATNVCSSFPPRDLVISSPTGSGKTLCYVIPILNALRECMMMNCLFALIVAPVQNLVDQIEKEFQKYNVFKIRIAVLCGSHDLNAERQQLEIANIAIATPGRLMEHITDLDFPVDFTHLRYLVVDEADRMSHTARIEWLNDLEAVTNYNHSCVTVDDLYNANFLQKILLSATLSLDVEDLHQWRLRHPRLFKAVNEDMVVTNELSLNNVIVPNSLKIEYIVCDTKFKPLATYKRIEGRQSWKKILIFVNSKMASYRLAVLLKTLSAGKYRVEELSSNLFGNRRQKVLARFRKGTTRVLIASDVLSRGIDVEDIDVVINYDKPLNERLFVHRVGRTARCGKKGRAIFLILAKEKKDFQTTLQNVSFTGKVKERNFEGVKDVETEELYGQALTKLKETLQNTQKGNNRNNGGFKKRRKKVAGTL